MSSNKFGVKTLVLDELALLATLNISQVSMYILTYFYRLKLIFVVGVSTGME
jgi:hypothetical protein